MNACLGVPTDWLYTPPMPDGLLPFRETIGPYQTALEQFRPLVDRWFGQADCPELIRLAFGSVLLDPVDSRQAGYRLLGRSLPAIRLDDEHSRDFSYQINRPRRSAVVNDLMINRLSKWSVGAFQSFVAHEGGLTPGEKSFACRLETDINSDPEFGRALPSRDLINLFREFVEVASELAESGDIP
jgi:hypothetical protein